jgi:protoporphyrinogen oxidase
MRDPQRINRVTDALNHLWHMCPDQRLYQLIHNVGYESEGMPLYAIEDEDWLERIEAAIEQMNGNVKLVDDSLDMSSVDAKMLSDHIREMGV